MRCICWAVVAGMFVSSAWSVVAQTPPSADSGFLSLFDGKSLQGWTQRGGKARYEVVDGVIVGTCVSGEPNSFLCTHRDYTNFVLELEFKVDRQLNSGIQIRSQCYEEDTTVKDHHGKEWRHAANRVHGYQVEIDASERGWSGGIYDEDRRGWLFDLEKKSDARSAFRQDAWNHFRIVCDGHRIQTWINGITAADLTDDMSSAGFIALQVHGDGGNHEIAGSQVRWRNIRIKEISPPGEPAR